MSCGRDHNTVREWDGIYGNWIEQGTDRAFEMREAHAAMLLLVPVSAKTLVDVGCGRGEWFLYIQTHRPGKKLRYAGVDFSGVAIRAAKQIVPEADLRVQDFVEAPLPWPDGSFDVVVSSHVVEHMNNPTGHIRDLVRITAPGGRLIVNYPVHDEPYVMHLHNDLSPEHVRQWLVDSTPEGTKITVEETIHGAPTDQGIVWAQL